MARSFRHIKGLASAAIVMFGALSAAAQPINVRKIAQWAEEDRFVSPESGSSRPGKWMNSTSPYALEPMSVLDADNPARRCIVCAAAQMLKSELFMNWAGQTINDDPAPMMLVLPSLDEMRTWNNTKWQPTLDAAVEGGKPWRVRDIVDRSQTGSTTAFKKFPGGFLHVTSASSSKGLQGRSVKRLCCDEVSEFPADAGGRGDPIKQAETRGDGHEEFKALHVSTPKRLPSCRITRMLNAGDHRLYYVACPHCGARQHLQFQAMKRIEGGRAVFKCQGCGELIDEIHKPALLEGGVWIKTYEDRDMDVGGSLANPENPAPPSCFPAADLAHWQARTSAGRDPSFHIWQAYSPFKSWSRLLDEYDEAKKAVDCGSDPGALITFYQQKLGQAWDDAADAPDYQRLFDARGKYVKRGVIPAWACEVIGVADVQGDRIEWDAYAFGPDLSCARFDWGVIDIDPLEPEAWAELGLVVAQRFVGEATVDLGFDAFGVDLGGKKGVTEKVYRFVRGRHNVFALKGSSDADGLPLVRGKRRTIRLRDGGSLTLEPYLVGGWGLKSVIYGALQTTLAADKVRLPGGLYNPIDATLEDFKGYASEIFRQPKTMRSGARGWWERLPGQANERLDLAVYARALAWSRGAFVRTPAEWQALFAARARTPEMSLPLFAAAETPPAIPKAEVAANPGNDTKRDFFAARKGL
jgi:phage terminase large subunit GpA-like protein